MNRILITTQNLSWHRRQHWQLSSLLQQRGDVPAIRVLTHSHVSDPYNEIAEKMKYIFIGKGLDVTRCMWDTEEDDREGFSYRSNVRTWDYQNLPDDCEWLLFTDPDMVFHPDFFATLQENIDKMTTWDKCIAICREMCDVPPSVLDAESYDAPIEDAADKIRVWNTNAKRVDAKGARPSSLGVGFFQLLHIPRIKELGITHYGTPNADKNIFHPKRKHYRTFSDKSVRKAFGVLGTRLLKPVYHIGHSKERKPDECF